MTQHHGVHTADNQMPPLGDDLEDMLTALRGIHPGLDQIADGYRLLCLDRHSVDMTQTLVAALGAWERRNVTELNGRTIARLADADTNPALRTLPLEQQKLARQQGQNAAYWLADPDLHQTAADTSAAIDGA